MTKIVVAEDIFLKLADRQTERQTDRQIDNTTTTTRHDQYYCGYRGTTLHYSTQIHILVKLYTSNYTTQHNSTLHYTALTTPQLQLKLQLHYAIYTTLPALHHTTSRSCGEVTTATIATIPENTTPTTFWSISGFALPSVVHNNRPLL